MNIRQFIKFGPVLTIVALTVGLSVWATCRRRTS